MDSKFNRRQLFRLRPRDLPNLSRGIRAQFAARKAEDEEILHYFRPPGALSDPEEFLDTCERCHACADACPHEVIRSLPASAGRAEDTPLLNPENAPCRWCPDMPCIEACPSGALTSEDDRTPAPIGKAVLNTETCLNSHGTLCDTCAMMCPSEARAIRMVNRMPQLDAERCVGCGLCVYYCESVPKSLNILPLEIIPEKS